MWSSTVTSRPMAYIVRWRRTTASASGSTPIRRSSARAKDPHVGLHLALAVEESGVGALAGLERLDVVGQLPLQVLGRVLAADHDDAALTAGGARLLAQGPVLPVELDRNRSPFRV